MHTYLFSDIKLTKDFLHEALQKGADNRETIDNLTTIMRTLLNMPQNSDNNSSRDTTNE